jgi:hypothetical protein
MLLKVTQGYASYRQVKKTSIQRISNDFNALDALENQFKRREKDHEN